MDDMGALEHSMMQGRRVLVTGCAGLLGGWLCQSLLEKGAQVIGLDRDYRSASRTRQFSHRMELVHGDIEDYDLVLRIMNEYEIEFVFHLAAQALVGAAARNPISTFKSNIQGTWNILEAARILKMTSSRLAGILVASSDKAYGDQQDLPYREDAPMQGKFPYDVSKSCADLLARSYFYSYRLPVCVSRCGNLYGGGDLNFSRIVPGTMRHSLLGQRPIIRSDGSPVRDYVYVKDAAQACILISEALINDDTIHGEAFNISNEQPLAVSDLVLKILQVCGRTDLHPVIENNASLEIHRQYLSSQKIRERLGWKAAYDLDSGLVETRRWYEDYLLIDSSASSTLARNES